MGSDVEVVMVSVEVKGSQVVITKESPEEIGIAICVPMKRFEQVLKGHQYVGMHQLNQSTVLQEHLETIAGLFADNVGLAFSLQGEADLTFHSLEMALQLATFGEQRHCSAKSR
jgi:hypothetical protein